MIHNILTSVKIKLMQPRIWILSLLYGLILARLSYNSYLTSGTELVGLYFFWTEAFGMYDARILLVLLTSLACVMELLTEIKSNFSLFVLNRQSIDAYMFGNLIKTIVVSSLVPILGFLLFSLFILTKYSFVGNIESPYLLSQASYYLNGHILIEGNPLLFYALWLLNVVYHHLYFVLISVVISLYIQDVYLTSVMPAILYTVFSFNGIPAALNPHNVFELGSYRIQYAMSWMIEDPKPWQIMIYPTVFFIIFAVIIYGCVRWSFQWQLRRGKI